MSRGISSRAPTNTLPGSKLGLKTATPAINLLVEDERVGC